MMKQEIIVIVKNPGRTAEPRIIPNTLEELQGFVGGHIEVYDLAADLAIICNEEGKLLGLPLNCHIAGEAFVGPIMLVGIDRRGEEFCDVPYSYDVLCAALGGQFKGGAV